ncbi:MAG: hypothetical protein R3A80_13750 [Bdellovibrionota bacterium]
MKGFLISSLSLILTSSGMMNNHMCNFVPENDLYIAADQKEGEETGITNEEFDSILNRIEKIYGPIIKAKGGTLEIRRLWTDGTVNASAERIGTTYRLNMYGGMARHKIMTADGFMLVACHEMGHHLGGKPKYSNWWPIGSESWASVEGQSDYFGTAKCMRRMFLDMTEEELADFDHSNEFAAEKCAGVYEDQKDQYMCLRNAAAGVVLGNVLGELGNTGSVNLETPSTEVFSGINQKHPKAQCRADTYFQGALCSVPFNVDFSDANHSTGACGKDGGFVEGIRPKCWFNPSTRSPRPTRGVAHQGKVFY